MTDISVNHSTLLSRPAPKKAPATSQIVDVAREFGVSPLRQLRELMALSRGAGKIGWQDYYTQRLFDPARSKQQKREFVGLVGSYALNQKLSPTKHTPLRAVIGDKLLYASMMRGLGFRTTTTQAVASRRRRFGSLPVLSDAAAIEAFLRNDARFPLFGKPLSGSGSVGSGLFTGIEGDALCMGDGRSVDIAELCREIIDLYPDGFVFQDAVRQHEMLTSIAGPAIGSIRVVTLRDEEGPKPLYAIWKIPSPEAMSDNFWQHGSMLAPVDLESGTLGTCRIGSGLECRESETHPVSGARIAGETLPYWKEILETASAAHAVLPDLGVIGFDIALTPDGPLIIEANRSPHHTLYGLAMGRGVLNSDLMPRIDAAIEVSKQLFGKKRKFART